MGIFLGSIFLKGRSETIDTPKTRIIMTIPADCVVCTCLEAQGAPELARPKNLDNILILNVLFF